MTGKNRRDESARIAIARIVDFAICFHQFRRGVEIYGMFRPAIFSKLDIIEIGDFRKMRFSDLDMLCAGTSVILEAGSVLEAS